MNALNKYLNNNNDRNRLIDKLHDL
jgi:hypothetical protein